MSLLGRYLLQMVKKIYHYCDRYINVPMGRLEEISEDPDKMGPAGVFALGSKYYDRNYDDTFETLKYCYQTAFNNGSVDDSDVVIHLAGDLMPYHGLHNGMRDYVGDQFFDADMVCANLETPIVHYRHCSYAPELMLNDMYFNADQDLFDVFCNKRKRSYHLLSLANNHMLDQKIQGLIATKILLNEIGIATVGFSHQGREDTTHIRQIGNIIVGYCAFTYSLNKEHIPEDFNGTINLLDLNSLDVNLSALYEQIMYLKESGCEYIIAMLHMGHAYQASPSLSTIAIVRRIFEECGPDLIVISHPHTLQPLGEIEFTDPFTGVRKKGLVAYSLGNFVANDIYIPTRLSGYLRLGLSKKDNKLTIAHEFIPTITHVKKDKKVIIVPIQNTEKLPSRLQQELQQNDDYCSLVEIYSRIK